MLAILKCKSCNSTFQLHIENFYQHDMRCTNCYSMLEPFHKQRLIDIADNLDSLNRFMDNFKAIGITEGHSKSYMLEDLTHIDNAYLSSDTDVKKLLDQIFGTIYLLSNSAIKSSNIDELKEIYEYINKLYSAKCDARNQEMIQQLLKPTSEA